MAPTLTTPVVTITDTALTKILAMRSAEDEADTLALQIAVTGARGAEFTYDLCFEPLAEADPEANVSEQGGLTVIVPATSVDPLRGATLDLPSDAAQGGLVLRNPNKPDPLGGVELELTGELPDKLTQLLDGVINPALAAHGGSAALVGVDGDVAYITMGGGCQGCAVSAMTLRDGIRRTILHYLPEITDVVDATDHSAGENPFY